MCILLIPFLFTGEIYLLKPIDEISAITHVGDPVLLTVIAEEMKVTRDEPPAMATTVQLALFLPERVNSAPYFENDQYVVLQYALRMSFSLPVTITIINFVLRQLCCSY